METAIQQIPLENFLFVSAIVFTIGMFGVLSRRNAVQIIMSVELMLNAVAVNFVAFSAYTDAALFRGFIFAIFVIIVAALAATKMETRESACATRISNRSARQNV